MRRARQDLRWLRHAGLRHQCPVCRARLRTFVAADSGLPRARCPRCDALQRHRLLWLLIERRTDWLRRPGRLLHFAPEPGLERRLRATAGIDYVSADLEPGAAMLCLDLEHLALPDASVDRVLCVHVLEHVSDDRRAMAELLRVLRPGGTAIITSPILGLVTDEDPSITDRAQRLARFGQADHVRMYGRDLVARLRDAGFEVDPVVFRDELSPAERRTYGLSYAGVPVDFDPIDDVWTIPVCRRPS